jgi:hypothetical protein
MTRRQPAPPLPAAARHEPTARQRWLGWGGAVIATGMTAVWSLVIPERAATATGLQAAAIRYGHPVCWALLAIVGVLTAIGAPRRARDAFAFAAGASYAAFLAGLTL